MGRFPISTFSLHTCRWLLYNLRVVTQVPSCEGARINLCYRPLTLSLERLKKLIIVLLFSPVAALCFVTKSRKVYFSGEAINLGNENVSQF